MAFIGAEVNRKLFGQSNAVGQTIRIRGISFEVIGVMKEKAQLSNYFRSDIQCVFVPYTVQPQLWYQAWTDVIVWQAVDPSQGPAGREAGVRRCWASWRTSIRPTSARCATGARPNPRKSRAAW